MKIDTELLKKFNAGEAITDAKLEKLLNFFTNLEESAKAMGPKYHFFWRDSFDSKCRLESYKEARASRS
jgi:hypothetical protein